MIDKDKVIDFNSVTKKTGETQVEGYEETVKSSFYKGNAIVSQKAFLKGGYDTEHGIREKFYTMYVTANTQRQYSELSASQFMIFAYLKDTSLYYGYAVYNRMQLAELLHVRPETISRTIHMLTKNSYLDKVELSSYEREKVRSLYYKAFGTNLERGDRWIRVSPEFIWRGTVGHKHYAPGNATKISGRDPSFAALLAAYGEPTIFDSLREEGKPGSFAETLKHFDVGD